MYDRNSVASLICDRIQQQGVESLKFQYLSSGKINYLVIDNLLPLRLAEMLDARFPGDSQLFLLNERQERKYVGVSFTKDEYLVEECIFAFQHSSVINLISAICGIPELQGDSELYAGAGVSHESRLLFKSSH